MARGLEPALPFLAARGAATGGATSEIISVGVDGVGAGVRLTMICKASCAMSQPAPPRRFSSPIRASSEPLPVPVRAPPPGFARRNSQPPAENLSPASTSP